MLFSVFQEVDIVADIVSDGNTLPYVGGIAQNRNGEVSFRKGPIYACAEAGGFGILDEINMAKNESLAVLHATLDQNFYMMASSLLIEYAWLLSVILISLLLRVGGD
ncbi:MAG: AAA family ATPase, partial [Bacteroidaceae bacterium]|nr:AAA family ATPase [Bacteroidaceae bacterium]